MAKLGLFEILDNIYTKAGGMLSPDDLQKDYKPYIINRALSMNRDLIYFANEMNTLNNIDKDMHYAFLYHGVPKRKRYGKWAKNTDDKEALETIKECFGYSYAKAKAVLPLLRDRVEEMRKIIDRGGKRK